MFSGVDAFNPSDQSIWLFCASLYLIDHLRLHSGREMILTETLASGWTPLLPLHGYRVAGRAVTLLRPFFPFLAAVRLGWLEREPFSRARLGRTATLLRSHQRSLAPFRALGCVNFIAIFAVGPILTSHAGLAYALAMVLPVHLAGIAFLAACLAARRHALRIKWPQVAGLMFECAVCPGFFVNVCRKVSLARARLHGDAVAFSLSRGGPGTQAALAYGLEDMVEDLAEHGELQEGDEFALAEYRVWLSERRSDV